MALLNLPDSLLLEIFLNLNAVELHITKSVCRRLSILIRDKYLWKYIDFGTKPLSNHDLRQFVNYFGRHTISIQVTGFAKSTLKKKFKSNLCISEAFFRSVKRRCINLKHLSLRKCYVDASHTNLSSLPKSLTSLSLEGSIFVNLPLIRTRINSPFFRLNKFLSNLKSIDLRGCNWISTKDVDAIHKLFPHLKETVPDTKIVISKIIDLRVD